MLRIAALDDDIEWLDVEKKITEATFSNEEAFEFYGYNNVEKFLLDLEDKEFEIYLLDMELPDTDGLKLARRIKRIQADPFIIYITNYVEYAVEAFEVNAFRYIPKNLLEIKLPDAYKMLMEQLSQKKERYFIIQNHTRMEKIPESQIYYLVKDKKYVYIKYRFGESRIRSTLEEVYQRLDQNEFIRIDKSYIVNLKHIMGLEKRQVKLRDGTYLDVSQPQLANVKKKISEYWRSGC